MIILAGYFNAQIGRRRRGLWMRLWMRGLAALSTFFRKQENNMLTFTTSKQTKQLDYILTNHPYQLLHKL